jgi:predicted MFS family arabinose efflux permease
MNYLSAARLFLFGSRDVWFVVGLPLFLAASLGWDHAQVGGYMAAWVIAYGFVQAAAPKLMRTAVGAPGGRATRHWIVILLAVTIAIAVAVWADFAPGLTVVLGLAVFGFVFAVNSAVHSYLVLAYSEADHVALNVGFYYMANAGGRLLGTVLSGLAYQSGGLVMCLVVSGAFLALAWLLSLALPEQKDLTLDALPGGEAR